MDALEAILTRTTVPPVKMGPPGPDHDQLQRILAAGAAAPDHGRLVPFRFLLIEGEARRQLGELFVRPLVERGDVSEEEIDKQRTAPARAPVIVVVIAKVEPDHPKIPAVEQITAAACAAQNILLAAHALGFAGKWATGRNAYDPVIRAGLGLGEHDVLTGFLYIGSYAAEHRPGQRPALETVVRRWPGSAR